MLVIVAHFCFSLACDLHKVARHFVKSKKIILDGLNYLWQDALCMANKSEKRPLTMGMTASQADWKLVDSLKRKTGIFKTGDLLKAALRCYSEQVRLGWEPKESE